MRATNVATLLITIALSSVIASCSSGPQIRVDGDPTVNLSSYKTFGFFQQVETDKSKYTTMISSRLKDATRRELQKRGYQEAEANPQLLVNFNTNVENRTDVQSTPSAGYYGYRAGAYGMWAGYPQDVQYDSLPGGHACHRSGRCCEETTRVAGNRASPHHKEHAGESDRDDRFCRGRHLCKVSGAAGGWHSAVTRSD